MVLCSGACTDNVNPTKPPDVFLTRSSPCFMHRLNLIGFFQVNSRNDKSNDVEIADEGYDLEDAEESVIGNEANEEVGTVDNGDNDGDNIRCFNKIA